VPDTRWERFLVSLYQITGQYDPMPDLSALREPLHLVPRIEQVSAGLAELLLVLLDKQVDEGETFEYTRPVYKTRQIADQ